MYTVDKVKQGSREPKEADEMKKNCLRGLLLGVSMALLLSGGAVEASPTSPLA